MADLRAQLESVEARLQSACQRAGRSRETVTLVAVSKTHPAETIAAAAALGLREFGENRIQEAAPKIAALAADPAVPPLVWHLVGHLQSNKAARAVELFDLIHSIDSPDLAREVARRAAKAGRKQRVLLQVNCSGELTKSGCAPAELVPLARVAAALQDLSVEGLMTIGPLDAAVDSARPAFQMLARLRRDAEQALGVALPHLSMGMTGDLEIAIQEGSTMVRVGTALFGQRPSRPAGDG